MSTRAVRVTDISGYAADSGWRIPWAAKVTAERAVHGDWAGLSDDEAVKYLKRAPTEVRDTAADLGSEFHRMAEEWAQRGEIDAEHYAPEMLGFIPEFRRFLETYEPRFHRAEFVLWNETHGYAGTCDALVSIRGQFGLLDYKSGSMLKAEHAVQLAAYQYAEHIVTAGITRPGGRGKNFYAFDADAQREPMPKTEAAWLLHIRPGVMDLRRVEHTDEAFGVFLDYLRLHREWHKNLARRVIGAKVVGDAESAIAEFNRGVVA